MCASICLYLYHTHSYHSKKGRGGIDGTNGGLKALNPIFYFAFRSRNLFAIHQGQKPTKDRIRSWETNLAPIPFQLCFQLLAEIHTCPTHRLARIPSQMNFPAGKAGCISLPPIRQAPTAPPGAKSSSSTLLQEGGGAGSKRSLPAQQSAVAF